MKKPSKAAYRRRLKAAEDVVTFLERRGVPPSEGFEIMLLVILAMHTTATPEGRPFIQNAVAGLLQKMCDA